MTGGPFIHCENLVKIYRLAGEGRSKHGSLEVQALQGLDFAVSVGEMVGVVGASGSGKSTLLNILGGLDRPTGGRAIVKGQDLGRMSQAGLDAYRRSTVGFVWQYGARNLVPYLTALENVELPVTLAGRFGQASGRDALKLLELVGLSERKSHRLEELSGGEQQRVAVAIALANKPSLLLADEPTGELDTATARTIYSLLRDLNRKLHLTIVIVSHDPGISHHVDRVVAVRDGKLASETVRVRAAGRAGQGPEAAEHVFEELAVLDAAGRLSIPRDLLEQFGIRRRVRMEVVEGGILIRPAAPEHDIAHGHSAPAEPAMPDEVEGPPAGPAWLDRSRKWLSGVTSRLPWRLRAGRTEAAQGETLDE
jgi:ABC-type lipoprotein export system ATPase subunit/bifunctional DNA-binding transcriptional regulator/antitoxin component of YhaV-PrlF toxin-antitoxin module